MKRARPLGLTVLGMGLLTACSAAPGEDTGRSNEALSTYDTNVVSISAQTYGILTSLLRVQDSTFQFANGQATFTPSSLMTTTMWPNDPVPANHSESVAIPSIEIPTPAPLGAYTATMTSLKMSDVSTDLAPSDLHVHGDFTGNLHLHSPNVFQPDFDVSLDAVSIDLFIGTKGTAAANVAANAFNGKLVVDNVVVNATTNVHNCFDGLCNGFIQSQMPNVGDILKAQIQNELSADLAKMDPTLGNKPYAGFLSALTSYEQRVNAAEAKAIIAGSPVIAGSQISFGMDVTPTKPSGCSSTLACWGPGEGMVEVRCTAAADDALQLMYWSGSAWLPGRGPSAYPGTNMEIGPGGTIYLEVCATNAAGTTCSDPLTVTTPATQWCPITTGGGTFGGGAPPKPCGGHICLQ